MVIHSYGLQNPFEGYIIAGLELSPKVKSQKEQNPFLTVRPIIVKSTEALGIIALGSGGFSTSLLKTWKC